MSEWIETQPTEPGWYWWRSDTNEPKIVELLFLFESRANQTITTSHQDIKRFSGLYIRGGTCNLYSLMDWDGGEWWSEQIPIPQEQP